MKTTTRSKLPNNTRATSIFSSLASQEATCKQRHEASFPTILGPHQSCNGWRKIKCNTSSCQPAKSSCKLRSCRGPPGPPHTPAFNVDTQNVCRTSTCLLRVHLVLPAGVVSCVASADLCRLQSPNGAGSRIFAPAWQQARGICFTLLCFLSAARDRWLPLLDHVAAMTTLNLEPKCAK